MAARWALVALAVATVALTGVALAQPMPPAQGASSPEAQALVKKLGSASYKERERAMRLLAERQDAYWALQEARHSPDAEVRRRADLILGPLKHRVQERAATELLHELRPGQVEGLVGRLVKSPGPAARDWQQVYRLTDLLGARASRIRGGRFNLLSNDPASLDVVRTCPPGGWQARRVVVDQLDHDVDSLTQCLVVSNGPVKHVRRINHSILLLGGNLGGGTVVRHSLIICRGNVGELTMVDDSIVLATGRLEGVMCAEHSLFQAQPLGRFTTSRSNVFLSQKEVAVAFPEDDHFVGGGPGPAKRETKGPVTQY